MILSCEAALAALLNLAARSGPALPLQTPGALGWLLVAGAVAAAPLLGAVRSGTVYRRASLRGFLSAAEAVAAAWLVAQYAAEVWWLRVSCWC
jgi:hypothetical protein